MQLKILMDLDNAAFSEGGVEEVGRILASVAERIPEPLDLSERLSLHDANGNYCGSAEIVRGDVYQDMHRGNMLANNAAVVRKDLLEACIEAERYLDMPAIGETEVGQRTRLERLMKLRTAIAKAQ